MWLPHLNTGFLAWGCLPNTGGFLTKYRVLTKHRRGCLPNTGEGAYQTQAGVLTKTQAGLLPNTDGALTKHRWVSYQTQTGFLLCGL
jgi:hypothetical protein